MTSAAMSAAVPFRAAWPLLLLGLGLLFWQTPARAADVKVVRLERSSADAVDPELWATLDPLLSHIGLRMLDESAQDEQAVANVVLSPDEGGVSILVFDPRRSATPVRRRVARSDSPALFRETVAQVVLSMVEPMAEAAPEAKPEPALPSAEPALPVAEAPREDAGDDAQDRKVDRLAYFIGARSAFGWVSRDHTVPSLGAEYGIRLKRRLFRGSLALDVMRALQHHVAARGTSADLNLTQFRFVMLGELFERGRFALDLGVGVGLDVINVPPRNPDMALDINPDTRRVQLASSLRTGVRIQLLKGIALGLGVNLDTSYGRARWVAEREGRQGTLFRSAALQPQLVATLSWTFAGPNGDRERGVQ